MLAKDTSDKRPLSKIYEVLLKINKKTKQKPKIWFKNGAETLTDTSSKKSYRWQMGMWEEAPLHISLLQKRWQASPSSRRLGVWSGKHDKALWDNRLLLKSFKCCCFFWPTLNRDICILCNSQSYSDSSVGHMWEFQARFCRELLHRPR